MLASMWNIYNALPFKNKTATIQDGRPTAHDVRLIASSYLDEGKIYVGQANDFFESDEDDTIIVHRKDMIVVRGVDMANVFDELCAIIERLDAWSLKLEELESQDGSLQAMVDACDGIINAPLFIYAPDGHALALSSAYPSDTHPHWAALVRDGGLTEEGLRFLKEEIDLPTVFKDRRPTRRPSSHVMPGSHDYIHCSLFPKGYMAAHVVCFGFEQNLPLGTEYLVGELGRHALSHMEAHFLSYNPVSKLARAFQDVFDNNVARIDEISGLTHALGWQADGPFVIACIAERGAGNDADQVLLPRLAHHLGTRLRQAAIVSNDAELAVVICGQDFDPETTHGKEFVAGWSVPFESLRDCRDYYLQARRELQRCLAENAQRSFATDHKEEELARLVKAPDANHEALAYVPQCLLSLKEHDEAQGTQYYETLKAYCFSGFHPATAAQLLKVHRNSFAYRLDRMREIVDLSPIDSVASSPSMEALEYLHNSIAAVDALW